LVAEARVSMSDGDTVMATDISLDLVELGAKIGRGGTLLETMVGTVIGQMGCRAVQPALNGLTLHDTRAAITRLDRILREFPQPAEVMDEERRLVVKGLRAEWGAPAQRLGVRRNGEPSWLLDGKEEAARLFYPRSWGYRRIDDYYRALTLAYRRVDAYYHDAIRDIGMPYCTLGPRPPAVEWLPGLADGLHDFSFAFAREAAALRLLRIELALQEYRGLNGHYPNALRDLQSRILPEVPLDPFTGYPFRYQQENAAYSLYSLGPDGCDDGGKAVSHVGFGRETEGDLVAGQLRPASWRYSFETTNARSITRPTHSGR